MEEARRGRRLEKWEEGADLGTVKGWAGSQDLPTMLHWSSLRGFMWSLESAC